MKASYIAFALCGLTIAGGFARSEKRGVSENQFSMGSMLEALEPGVTWYYNWAGTPGKGYENQVIDFEDIEFVPMCWNASYNADAIREYCRSHPKTKYILGFNEPNFTQQANMTPQQAAEAWPAVQALAKELGLQIVAPALNYSPNPPYTDPLKWMDEFVALVGPDAFDYTAIHNYGGLGVMKTLAGNFHDRYGKDVWVTEFCYWPNEGDSNSYVAPATQIDSMTETLKWLETTPWIFRYAWFKALGNSNASKGPNYGLLVQEGSGLGPWGLSEQGKVYVGLGDFNPEVWHPVKETVSATEFVDSNLLGVGGSKDSGAKSIIEINRFNAGADALWQFDVPQAGEYVITLHVSGFGEPTRFDPQLEWLLVDGSAETSLAELKPMLPNSETEYIDVTSTVTLPSGHVQLRLKDKAPYQPSGIRISTLRLDDVAGIVEPESEAYGHSEAVYNLQGVRVGTAQDFETLPSGFYILKGKKIKK